MLTTNRKEWNDKFHSLRVHGMNMSAAARHSSNKIAFEAYTELGYNYRLTDIQAAIGREQLKKLPTILEKRRYLAERYHEKLQNIPGLSVPFEPEWARSNWQSYCIRLPLDCNQLTAMQHMLDKGIATRRGIICAHREPAYAKEPWSCVDSSGSKTLHHTQNLIESELAQEHCILLPVFHQMTQEDQERVVSALISACRNQAAL